jgi:protein TonB
MLTRIVLGILVAHAPVTSQGVATQQPTASPAQTTSEKPWPPAGVFRHSDGVTLPRVVKETKPHLPAGAHKANVQGVVMMEAVVQTDGTVGEVRVIRSLDKKFGVDEEAVKTLKRWRFTPGKKDGVAVPVLIEVEMTFVMR